MTVTELATRMNISIRTLHYYDEIGLLKPYSISVAGHRIYEKEQLVKLQQILIFRELNLKLKEIKAIMLSDDYDIDRVLSAQRGMLELSKQRMTHLIGEIDCLQSKTDESEISGMDFSESRWEMIWDEIYENFGEVQNEVLEPVKDYVSTLKLLKGITKVLDLGCGTGRNTLYLSEQGFQVTATDISDKALNIVSAKAKKFGYDIQTSRHDIREIPYKDHTFDALLCSWVSGHGTHEDMVKQATEMLRVVRPGGKIFVDYPSKVDERYGIGDEIAKDSFLNNMPGEEKIPHHYSDIEEIEGIYQGYIHDIKPYTYHYYDGDIKHNIEAYIVIVTL